MPLERYGHLWNENFKSDLEIELTLLGRSLMGTVPANIQSPGAYRHFRNAESIIWNPKQTKDGCVWNPWTEWAIRSFCENRTSVWAGAGSAGKTFSAGLIAMLYYAVAPTQTSVILTSTTGKMVRKRIWPVIQQLYWANQMFPGNLVDSKTMLQSIRGDDKHGIFAMAVREGPTAKAVSDIQGVHAPRMLLVIDEATDTPEAIFEAIANLRKACLDFRVIIIGNPTSLFDPHGICATPKDGWGSVSVESEEWEVPGVPKWEIDPGVCLHFDGTKSPNIKLGENKYRFLPTQSDLNRAKSSLNGEESIGYWKYTRGFWAPEGICRTIFSENLIIQKDGFGKHTFISNFYMVASLDPAFGGDRCKLKFGKIGDIDNSGKLGIQLDEGIVIPLKATAKQHIHYQIAHRVIEECEKRGVRPEHFALDASGEGGGLASIIVQEWSDRIVWVEFGGAPSDLPVSEEDQRPCNEVYDRKVTELWFSCRNFLIAGQLKGLDRDECNQFCTREFSDKKRKIVLDTKDDVKAKLGRSPDDADAVSVMCELAKKLGVMAGGKGVKRTEEAWKEAVKETQQVYENVAYERESFEVW